jgi:predicted N-formylglutamate amidohydrolase
MTRCKKEHQLLGAEDSPPFESINISRSESPVLIVCDHASNYVPLALNGLGIDARHMQQHIAYDIGAAGVSRYMASDMNVMAVLAGFSRLVLDPNRFLTAHDSIPSISDGVVIPANESLSATDRMLRVEELFIPYHMAINRAISHLLRFFSMPLILSVHSYTPIFQGFERPWEIGVLWEGDDGVASLLIDYLREHTDYHVGENEPYHACNPLGYTVKTHAESKHYPHVLIEIRQDLIADSQGQMKFAGLLTGALEMIQSTLGAVITRPL